MKNSDLPGEKSFEVERKFRSIWGYVLSVLEPGETLTSWHVGKVRLNAHTSAISDKLIAYRKIYPSMDITTWKTYLIVDCEVRQKVEQKLKEAGFDIDTTEATGEVDTIYIFRKKAKNW